jgi:hypothetical protein
MEKKKIQQRLNFIKVVEKDKPCSTLEIIMVDVIDTFNH